MSVGDIYLLAVDGPGVTVVALSDSSSMGVIGGGGVPGGVSGGVGSACDMGAAIWEKATCRVGCRESPRRHMGVLHGDNATRAGRKQIQRDVKRPSPDTGAEWSRRVWASLTAGFRDSASRRQLTCRRAA